MIRHAASYPELPRPVDWRDRALCRGKDIDPEDWFPIGKSNAEKAAAQAAKRICRACPSRPECLAFGLDPRNTDGIFGGYDEDERASLRRAIRKGTTTVAAAAAAPKPPVEKPRTLRSLFNEHTARTFGGHLEWVGSVRIAFQGCDYTPRRIAFILDRGFEPTGHVLTDCDHKGCIRPAHLTDAEERGVCGTITAFRRHVVRGERVDKACQAVAPQAVAS